MIFTTFEYPLPNNGERYDLSEEELCALLESAYMSGRASNSLEYTTTVASTKKSYISIEQIFDSLINEAVREPGWKATTALKCAKKEVITFLRESTQENGR